MVPGGEEHADRTLLTEFWARRFECDPSRRVADVYELKQELGQGGFGVVSRAIHRDTGVRRAVKRAELSSIESAEALVREAQMMRKIGEHDHVVQLVDAFVDGDSAYIVLEMCFGIDLFDWIDLLEGKPTSEKQVATLFRHMVLAVQHCHRQGVLHQDVKLENFILDTSDGKSKVKIIDFGVSEALDLLSEERMGSEAYYAPELIEGVKTPAGDVWALGLCFYVMLTSGLMPQFSTQHKRKFTPRTMQELRKSSHEAVELCLRMLDRNHETRITTDHVLESPFFKFADVANEHEEITRQFLRLEEHLHSTCFVFGMAMRAPASRGLRVEHVAKREAARQSCLVLSGTFRVFDGRTCDGARLASPGDTIDVGTGAGRSETAVAETDADVLVIPEGSDLASVRSAAQRGRRLVHTSGFKPTEDLVRRAEKRLQMLCKLLPAVLAQTPAPRTRQLERGAVLVEHGGTGREAYLLLSGVLDVFDAAGVQLDEFGPGHLVGEMAALLGTRRTATLIARTDAVVLPLTTSTLEDLQHDKREYFWMREVADKRDLRHRIVRFLRRSSFFGETCDPKFLNELALVLRPKFVRAGGQVVERARNERMVMVQQGEVRLQPLDGGPGREAVLRGIGAVLSDSFPSRAPSGTVWTAATDCELLSLSQEDFDMVVDRFPDELRNLESISGARSHTIVR